MNKNYPSFASGPIPDPDYDYRELKADGYILKGRCNRTNPDCQKYIKTLEQKNDSVKIIKLNITQHGNNMIDIWIKKQDHSKKS